MLVVSKYKYNVHFFSFQLLLMDGKEGGLHLWIVQACECNVMMGLLYDRETCNYFAENQHFDNQNCATHKSMYIHLPTCHRIVLREVYNTK